MTEKPLVSIVIPVYNGSNYVSEAIESALNQTYKNIEVIVVNDGSTDNTEQAIERFRPRIKYFRKKNGGVASTLNFAIRKAQGKYISWLSHDDLYMPHKIEVQIDKILNLPENERESILYFSNFDIKNEDSNSYYANSPIDYQESDDNYQESMLKIFFESKINACTILFPKELFSRYGLFDENLKTVQDYTLLISFFKEGIKFKYINERLIVTRFHARQDTRTKLEKHLVELNTLYTNTFEYFKDYFGKLTLWELDYYLNVIKNRGLDLTYANILSRWGSSGNVEDPTIWMYWENKKGVKIPDYIRLCWKTIVVNNRSSFNIRILNEKNVEDYLPGITLKVKTLKEIAHKADYIRFNLLYKFGGIWLDSDFICIRNLAEIKNNLFDYEFICNAYLHKTGKFFPIINFLAATKKSLICKEMITEMDKSIKLSATNSGIMDWDSFGGWNLANYINNKKYKSLIYDSKRFMPFRVYEKGNMELLSEEPNILTDKLNSSIFGQAFANSVLEKSFVNREEIEWLDGRNIASKLFLIGLGCHLNYLIISRISNANLVNTQRSQVPYSLKFNSLAKKFLHKILLYLPIYRKLQTLDILINERCNSINEILNGLLEKQKRNEAQLDAINNYLKIQNKRTNKNGN